MNCTNITQILFKDHIQTMRSQAKEAVKAQKIKVKEAAKAQKVQQKEAAKAQKVQQKEAAKAQKVQQKKKAKELAKLANIALTAAAKMWLKELSIQEKELLRRAKKAEKQEIKTAKAQELYKKKQQKLNGEKRRKLRQKRLESLEKGTEKGLYAVRSLFKKKHIHREKVAIVPYRRRPLPNMEGIAYFMRVKNKI